MDRSAPLPPEIVSAASPVVALVGAYGSGKTEVAINLALGLAAGGARVQLADLDLVNPYFRSREARQLLRRAGIRVVVPPGDQVYADLPIVLPEIAGLLHPPAGTITVLDVGGDDVGARALAAFRPRIADGGCELWQVINGRRPFSATTTAVASMITAVESASRLPVTGLVANSHLLEETTIGIVLEGWELARETARQCELPLRAVALLEALADDPALARVDAPLLRLTRRMLPPWCSDEAFVRAASDLAARPCPAPRALPIGHPDPTRNGDHHG